MLDDIGGDLEFIAAVIAGSVSRPMIPNAASGRGISQKGNEAHFALSME
jgi:hypothetical protein